jgi:hypothetical protein
MDRLSAGRLAVALVVLVAALILAGMRVPGAAYVAGAALLAGFIVCLFAKWSWRA